ncbi:MAG: hypothetical protein AABY61_08515 [Nitrospirota bacterium]
MGTHLSKAKLEANQVNAKASTGPVNTVSTRYNAVKHGLLSQGVTELDELDYPSILSSVKESLKPVGPIETALSEHICLCLVRLKRAHGLEARFITGELHPPISKKEGGFEVDLEEFAGKLVVIDPGIPAPLKPTALDSLTGKFQRYETAIENKLYRALHELERLQRGRKGEKLPVPATVDVGLHSDHEQLASFGNSHQ